MLNAGRVLSREQLEQHLYSWGQEVDSNTVEVHIHHLRASSARHLIQTVRGVGYTLLRGTGCGMTARAALAAGPAAGAGAGRGGGGLAVAAVSTWFDVQHELDELLDGHLAQAAALLVVQQAR
jgi:hypothetical protein